jgi:hypothetical protein
MAMVGVGRVMWRAQARVRPSAGGWTRLLSGPRWVMLPKRQRTISSVEALCGPWLRAARVAGGRRRGLALGRLWSADTPPRRDRARVGRRGGSGVCATPNPGRIERRRVRYSVS